MSDIIPPPRKSRQAKIEAGKKLKGKEKMARMPIKFAKTERAERLKKPDWIRAKFPGTQEVLRLKSVLRDAKLATVCEEASCPNLGECFTSGTATFMIMGEICTRRCPFCDVAHGRPLPLDVNEPRLLAETVRSMKLRYVVVTSVDRDDLRDGGAQHFVDCIDETRALNPDVQIEVLVPDFRGRMEVALEILKQSPSDVFNHNLETIPRLYKQSRPGSDYQFSLDLLKAHKALIPDVPTKSGIMVGLGEDDDEVIKVMEDMRAHDVNMVTLGQYLQPSLHHLPVHRYVTPEVFDWYRDEGLKMGFDHVASGPMVRSSYHADIQAQEVL